MKIDNMKIDNMKKYVDMNNYNFFTHIVRQMGDNIMPSDAPTFKGVVADPDTYPKCFLWKDRRSMTKTIF